MSATKLDLRKTLKPLYGPPTGEVEVIRIPPMSYIMIDGKGEPVGESFQQAMGVLYGLAYTLKFRCKKLLKKDFTVMAPEGLWWMKGRKFDLSRRKDWLWTLMTIMPDFVTPKLFAEAVNELRERKDPPGLERARLEAFDEGYCVQIMHVGPYSEEPKSIAKLDAFCDEHEYRMVGKHHEIYFGDPRRTAPSKLRTILRHPVAEAP